MDTEYVEQTDERWTWRGLLALLGLTVLIFVLWNLGQAVLVVTYYAAGGLLGILPDGAPRGQGDLLAFPTVAGALVILLLVWIGALLLKQSPIDFVGFRNVAPGRYLVWTLAVVVVVSVVDLVKFFSGIAIIPPFVFEIHRTSSQLWLLYLALVVGAPLGEELLFRGFFQSGLRRTIVGVWGAVLIPALLWTIIHMQYEWYDLSGLFLAGLVLGLARHKTASVYVPIVMHAVVNALAVVQFELHLRYGWF